MRIDNPRGMVYVCPICGAEITVVGFNIGKFTPHCCNVEMIKKQRRLTFYVCPLCGAEIAVLNEGTGRFTPRCCATEMQLIAA